MGMSFSPDRADVDSDTYVAASITVGTSQVLAAVGVSNLTSRQELLIYNKSNTTIYFGPTGVTTATGIPIEPTGVLNLPFGQNINVYLISATPSLTVIIQELA